MNTNIMHKHKNLIIYYNILCDFFMFMYYICAGDLTASVSIVCLLCYVQFFLPFLLFHVTVRTLCTNS